MMTLEQIGALAMLWHEAETDVQARVDATPQRPLVRASQLMIRRHLALRRACRDYKLLHKVCRSCTGWGGDCAEPSVLNSPTDCDMYEEAKGKGANDGTV